MKNYIVNLHYCSSGATNPPAIKVRAEDVGGARSIAVRKVFPASPGERRRQFYTDSGLGPDYGQIGYFLPKANAVTLITGRVRIDVDECD